MTIKLRYKKPDEEESKLIVHPLLDKQYPAAKDIRELQVVASVAAFGMLLRDSEYVKNFQL
jgi:Ca-activated chloride channel family protein